MLRGTGAGATTGGGLVVVNFSVLTLAEGALMAATAEGEATGTTAAVPGAADFRTGRGTSGFNDAWGSRRTAKGLRGRGRLQHVAAGVRLVENLQIGGRPVEGDG